MARDDAPARNLARTPEAKAAQLIGAHNGGMKAAGINRESRRQGLAFAARWKAGRREEVLSRAAFAASGLAPTAAARGFPYDHPTCAEWR